MRCASLRIFSCDTKHKTCSTNLQSAICWIVLFYNSFTNLWLEAKLSWYSARTHISLISRYIWLLLHIFCILQGDRTQNSSVLKSCVIFRLLCWQLFAQFLLWKGSSLSLNNFGHKISWWMLPFMPSYLIYTFLRQHWCGARCGTLLGDVI